jgi:transcription antitermination factor NusG
MQKNWYIIYTKPKAEKKVSKALKRKKIEYYVPMNSRTVLQSTRTKIHKEPLFQNYLFAHLSKEEFSVIASLNTIINFVYWKREPVVVTEDDLSHIKNFTTNYTDIKVEKTEVNLKETAKVIDGSHSYFSGNALIIRNSSVKINFPTIGFSIFAEIESNKMPEKDKMTFDKNLIRLQ